MVVQTGSTCGTKHPQGIQRFYFIAGELCLPLYHLKLIERHEQQSSKSRAVSLAAEPAMTIDHEFQIIVDGIFD
jgi:hypothetical protein